MQGQGATRQLVCLLKWNSGKSLSRAAAGAHAGPALSCGQPVTGVLVVTVEIFLGISSHGPNEPRGWNAESRGLWYVLILARCWLPLREREECVEFNLTRRCEAQDAKSHEVLGRYPDLGRRQRQLFCVPLRFLSPPVRPGWTFGLSVSVKVGLMVMQNKFKGETSEIYINVVPPFASFWT